MRLALVGIALCLTLVAAQPSWAQRAQPRQPSSGGLFGATRSDVGGSQKLNVTAEVAEGFDSELPPELASNISRSLQAGGFSTILEAGADYAHGVKRTRLAANASTAFRYYQDLDRFDALSHTVGVGANLKLPKGGNFQIDQAAAYSPSYLYQLFPVDDSPGLGESIPANPDYQIAQTDSYSYNTRLELSYGNARETHVRAFGTLHRTDFQNQVSAAYADLDIHETGAAISHQVSPSGAFSLQYAYRSGEYGSGGLTEERPTEEHRVTVGAEFSPALSRTRRATFRVELTPTWFNGVQLAPDASTSTQVSVSSLLWSGEASVSYPFRPNWRSTARYRRDVQHQSVLGQPVVTDGARVEVAGLLGRRVDLGVSAGYVSAASIVSQSAQTLETYTGQVAIRYALKRSIALYSEYLYYYYDQRGQEQFVRGLPPVFEQHGVRFGVALFIEPLGR